MANMEVTDRAQYERHDLGASEHLRRGSRRGATVYTLLSIPIAAALSYAALTVIEGWAQWLVLAVIVLATIGMIIAVNPARRHAG
jgi:hypothetical protein